MNKWIFILILTTPILTQAQEKNPKINGWIRSGNSALENGDSARAVVFYDRVLAEDPDEDRARFNKALAMAKPEKIEEAMTLYQMIAENNENDQMRTDAWYNMGNLAFRQQQFDKAVEYYKNALRLDPNDQDAKHNYYLAKNMQQQQEQQQQQQQGDQNQDQKDQNQDNQQQEQQDQQDQGDQQQNGQQEQEQEQDQQEDGNQGQDSESNQDQREQQQGNQAGEEQEQQEGKEQKVPVARLSKEETERLLEALENQEKQLQGKLLEQKPKKKGRKPEKDW